MTEVKIAIIGAGSAVFSMRLVGDICLTDSLRGSTLCFMDIDEKRLEIVYHLAKRYMDENQAQLKLVPTLERQEALIDADFVINTALVGGHTHVEEERKVEEENGYYRGLKLGSYLHQLQLMLSVTRDMEDLCPTAWLLQASNPVFDGCTLMTRESTVKVMGLCHGHHGVYKIAHTLGLQPDDISFQAPGVNHCIWMSDFRHKGINAYPLLDEWIETKADAYWRTWDESPTEVQMSPAAVNLYKMFGLFPIGDTPRFAGAWWHHVDLATKKRWFNKYGGFDSEIGWNHYLRRLEARISKMSTLYQDSSIHLSNEFPPVLSSEQHIPIIDALVNDHEGKYQVNVPNKGALPGLADDVVVEVPGIVSGRGVQAVHVDPLPPLLTHHILRTQVLPMELGLEAYKTGDKRILLNRVLADHRTQSYEQAEQVIEAVLNLHFNQDLKKHFHE